MLFCLAKKQKGDKGGITLAFFSYANLEAVRYDFKLRDRCYPCWRRDCNQQGGNKPPRLRQTPREPQTPILRAIFIYVWRDEIYDMSGEILRRKEDEK